MVGAIVGTNAMYVAVVQTKKENIMKQVEYDCIKAIDDVIRSKRVSEEIARRKLVSTVGKLVEAEQMPQSALDEYIQMLDLDSQILSAQATATQAQLDAQRAVAAAQTAEAQAQRALQRLQVQRARLIDSARAGRSASVVDSCGRGVARSSC